LNKQNFTHGYGLEKFFDSVVYWHRQKMYQNLSSVLNDSNYKSILDIGSTSDTGKSSNAFLHFLRADKIVSISDQEIMGTTRKQFPHVQFKKDNGLKLSIENSSFDLVFSNAVIEHVGNLQNIEQFINEAVRVAKHRVVLITPNRWFFLETHTKLLFLHWIPAKYFRFILKKIGMEFFSLEENLNLLSKSMLHSALSRQNIENFSLRYVNFLGYPSNIVVTINLGQELK